MKDIHKHFGELAEKAADIAYPVFVYQGWKYFYGFPDRDNLRDTILDLLVAIKDRDTPVVTASSGRFLVEKVYNADIDENLYSVNLELAGDV